MVWFVRLLHLLLMHYVSVRGMMPIHTWSADVSSAPANVPGFTQAGHALNAPTRAG